MSQLHEPGAASMPSVLVGGSEEDANPEQLTRKDLRPQLSPPNLNLQDCWDSPDWQEDLPALFNIEAHFDNAE